MTKALRADRRVPLTTHSIGKGRDPERHGPGLRVCAGAFLLIALISGCAATGGLAKSPRVTLAHLRLAEVGLIEQRYTATLRIQNPNDVELGVRGIEYTIYVNEREFANGVSGRSFTVPRYGEETIEVNMTSTVLRVFEQLKSLSDAESKSFRYRITGNLSLAGLPGSIPFSHEDSIDLSGEGSG